MGITSGLSRGLSASIARSAAATASGFKRSGNLAILGDSITNQNSTYFTANTIQFLDTGYAVWAQTLMRNRFQLVRRGSTDYDFGNSGKRADEILAYVPDVIAAAPGACFVLAGTNDAAQGATAATIRDRVVALWLALRAGGIQPLGATVTPSSNGTHQAVIEAANLLIIAAGITYGVPVCVWPETLKSGSTASATLFPDGIHPNALGAAIMGSTFAAFLDKYITAAEFAIPASGSSAWVTPNPYVTGGTTFATSWQSTTPATDTTVTASKVDGKQQIVIAGTGTGQNIIYAQNLDGTTWDEGDTIRCLLDLEGVASGWNFKNICAYARCHTSAAGSLAHYMGSAEATALPSANTVFSGLMVGPPVTIPVGTTRVQIYIQTYGTGTFRFPVAGVIKV
jgi:lysophospholipase L1-like esterase